MNDVREILKLVVEHKAMRKLYSINGIDNSLINKMIVEELLGEQGRLTPEQIVRTTANSMKGKTDEQIRSYLKNSDNKGQIKGIMDAINSIGEFQLGNTKVLMPEQQEAIKKFIEIKKQVDEEPEDTRGPEVDVDPEPVTEPEPVSKSANVVTKFFKSVEELFPRDKMMRSPSSGLYTKFEDNILNIIKEALKDAERIDNALTLIGYINPTVKNGIATLKVAEEGQKEEIRKRYLETVIKTFRDKEALQKLKDLASARKATESIRYVAENLPKAYLSSLNKGYISAEPTNDTTGPIAQFVIGIPDLKSLLDSEYEDLINNVNSYRRRQEEETSPEREDNIKTIKGFIEEGLPKVENPPDELVGKIVEEIKKLGSDTIKELEKMVKEQIKDLPDLSSPTQRVPDKKEEELKEKLKQVLDLFISRIDNYIQYANDFAARAKGRYDDLDQREDLFFFVEKTIPAAIENLEAKKDLINSKIQELVSPEPAQPETIDEVRLGTLDTEKIDNQYEFGEIIKFINDFAKEFDKEGSKSIDDNQESVTAIFKKVLDMTQNKEVFKVGPNTLINDQGEIQDEGSPLDTRLTLSNFPEPIIDRIFAENTDSDGLNPMEGNERKEQFQKLIGSGFVNTAADIGGKRALSFFKENRALEKEKKQASKLAEQLKHEMALAFVAAYNGYSDGGRFSLQELMPQPEDKHKSTLKRIDRRLRRNANIYAVIKILHDRRRQLSGLPFKVHSKVLNDNLKVNRVLKFYEFFQQEYNGDNLQIPGILRFLDSFFPEPDRPVEENLENKLKPIVEAILNKEQENNKMKNDMNLIMESWRSSVISEDVRFQTIGDLKKAIKAAEFAIKNPKAKSQMSDAAQNLAIALLKDAIPGGNTIGMTLEAGKGLYGVLSSVYELDDSKNVSKGLKSMSIDDNISAVVDDKVELQFLKYLTRVFGQMSDNVPISSLNVEELLFQFIQSKYGGVKIKKS